MKIKRKMSLRRCFSNSSSNWHSKTPRRRQHDQLISALCILIPSPPTWPRILSIECSDLDPIKRTVAIFSASMGSELFNVGEDHIKEWGESHAVTCEQ